MPRYQLSPAHKALSKLTYPDLKIACITKGMEFQDIVEGDHSTLSSYFLQNYDNKSDTENLEYFDAWIDEQLELQGIAKNDPLRQYKLSSVVDPATNDLKIRKKRVSKVVKVPKKKRVKRERNEQFNIIKGTKKEYVYTLVQKLHDKGKNLNSKKIFERLLASVIEKYGDASEKSVKIWFNRAKKELD